MEKGERPVPSDLTSGSPSRWRAFTHHAGRLWEIAVEHPPWSPHVTRRADTEQDLADPAGLPRPLRAARRAACRRVESARRCTGCGR
ncbi:DUF2071 domain-containing protein [Kitasatospora terrestris]|uniref:DUF2071 domain-containing protein n=1 Tax=Kitasatospora terrestris TaxID=258051 RepID=UPI003CD09F28